MGMFDYIEVPDIKCPKCGEILSEWQSKDGECDLEKIPYWKVDNFYTNCDSCDTWYNFNRKNKPKVPLDDYELSYRDDDKWCSKIIVENPEIIEGE